MKILTSWLREYVPGLTVDDRRLAEDLTLRGIAVEGVHDLGVDAKGKANGHLFEMDLTTNRVDAMNHYGIAREIATMHGQPLTELDGDQFQSGRGAEFSVRIEARSLCGRFTARVLRAVTIAPSAGMVAERFGLLGLKAISNAVDASNYVLQAMGHPTHAFDLDRVAGGIVVRLARAGERLRLLDGREIVLAADDLVVADEVKALGLAGVMGGWESMITPATKNILVEAAWFDPASVRRSARRHGLHTDASHRYERGADFAACATANALVAGLILKSGGRAEGVLVDVVVPELEARTAQRPAIMLSVEEVKRHLGMTLARQGGEPGITGELIVHYLTGLGCQMRETGAGTFAVTLPSWRLDLEREIDLVEEIARVYGYNAFANTLPTPLPVVAHPLAAKEAAVRERLLELGFSEAISTTFGSDAEGEMFGPVRGGRIALENPLSEEARLLRPSLVPGMVGMIAHNLNRDVRTVRLFEQGTVFGGSTDKVRESASLSLGLTGDVPASRLHAAKDAGFFELKGAVGTVLDLFVTEKVTYVAETPAWMESGRGATVRVGSTVVATLGELSREQREARKLRQAVCLAEVDLEALYALPLRRPVARELSRFQAVERDFSFTFEDGLTWRTVEATIESLAIPELVRLEPVEIFRDAKGISVPPGHYALLLRCVFQSQESTLQEEWLTLWWAAIIAALSGLGGVIRAGG